MTYLRTALRARAGAAAGGLGLLQLGLERLDLLGAARHLLVELRLQLLDLLLELLRAAAAASRLGELPLQLRDLLVLLGAARAGLLLLLLAQFVLGVAALAVHVLDLLEQRRDALVQHHLLPLLLLELLLRGLLLGLALQSRDAQRALDHRRGPVVLIAQVDRGARALGAAGGAAARGARRGRRRTVARQVDLVHRAAPPIYPVREYYQCTMLGRWTGAEDVQGSGLAAAATATTHLPPHPPTTPPTASLPFAAWAGTAKTLAKNR